ncbi:hypothetical protein [Maribacter sp. 4G9]|uniref:hypothetical protein n=1 Tax=Maribacter sp. 4G9 TaxID=1889777 RepID=UPI000C15E6F8|nr:hypothetical protein [Maribacter sp. 4G9]PIB22937.1 hypothetical protein BFP75_10500 [Maribacter sp. 4G9]
MAENVVEGKNTAIISYLTLIGALIAITMNMEPKHDFARFHIRQAFGIHLLFHAFALFSSVWYNQYGLYGLYICYLALWFYGFLGALNNKKQDVPLLGTYFQKWFTFIQ